MKKKNWLMITLIIVGAILFGTVAMVVIRSQRTVNAVVLSQEVRAGEKITNDMLKVIQVPAGTPKGFITDRSSLIGQKLKINAEPNQLLYMSDIIMSWGDVLYGVSIPDDYIITAISMPDERAVGGLITAGDTVDIFGVPSGNNLNYDLDGIPTIISELGPIVEHGYGMKDGREVYALFANVKILETDSTLSNEDQSILASITEGAGNNEGAYYIIALSYSDYQKLLLVQNYMTLWMSLAPAWNSENGPLLDFMTYSEVHGLMDAQAQSVIEVIENSDGTTTSVIKEEALLELEETRERWMKENNYIWSEDGKMIKVEDEEAYNYWNDSDDQQNVENVDENGHENVDTDEEGQNEHEEP